MAPFGIHGLPLSLEQDILYCHPPDRPPLPEDDNQHRRQFAYWHNLLPDSPQYQTPGQSETDISPCGTYFMTDENSHGGWYSMAINIIPCINYSVSFQLQGRGLRLASSWVACASNGIEDRRIGNFQLLTRPCLQRNLLGSQSWTVSSDLIIRKRRIRIGPYLDKRM